MKHSFLRISAVARREISASLASPAAWVFLVLFLVMSGICTFVASDLLASGQADLGGFFNWMPWLFLFLVPALGMPFWSEERRTGTFDLTLSYPVTISELVTGKYLAGMFLLAAALLFTLATPVTVYRLGSPDTGAVLCGYFGALMIGSAFLSVTSFCSALTKSQTASFLLALMLCGILVFTGWDRIAVLIRQYLPGPVADGIAALSIIPHYQAFQRGLLDTTEIVYCLSITVLFLFCTGSALSFSAAGNPGLLTPGALSDGKTWKSLGRLAGGILAAFYCFFCILYAAGSFHARIDCTSDRAYSISDLSRKLVRELPDKVSIRFYLSSESADMPNSYRQYGERVRWLLSELARESGGKIELSVIAPENDARGEEIALLDGVRPVRSQTGEGFFLGLAVSRGAEDEVIPFLFPQEESLLEYNVIRKIRNVSARKRKVVGLMSEFPLLGRMPEPQHGISAFPAWHIFREVSGDYDFAEIPLDTPAIPEGVDVLLVVHPVSIGKRGENAIRQYLARGGRALVFLDPRSSFAEASARKDYSMMDKVRSDLPELLPEWGFTYDPESMAADLVFKLDRVGSSGVRQTVPSALRITREGIARLPDCTARLLSVWMNYAGVPELTDPRDGLTYELLLHTSKKACTVPVSARQEQVFADFKNTERDPLPLAWHISGMFPASKTESGAASGMEKKTGEVWLFLDMDMLFHDACVIQTQDDFGQRLLLRCSDNITLFQNMLEAAAGLESLAELRSRVPMNRPMRAIREAREKAELQFRDGILSLMREYEKESRTVDTIRRTMLANPGRVQLTPVQEKLLLTHARREAEFKREIKEFRGRLKTELDAISADARRLNIVIMPAAAALLGLLWGLFRKGIRRRRKS
ncbi:MAG: Gldg family protein [Lentisphaeria bacterium]|nr:Gldg family protein [Lentisphaeria bacterium]